MSPLTGPLKKVYEQMKEPPKKAPSDWALIEASKVAQQQLDSILKDIALKHSQLVQAPLDVRTALDKRMVEIEAQIASLQQELIEAKADYVESETQWLEGQKSFEAIKVYYEPQLISLRTQANYIPLAQRSTVSRRRKPKNKK